MSIGIYSIGEGSIGEPIVSAGGVTLDVPVATAISVSGQIPTVQVGALVDSPAGTISTVGKIPTLQVGTLIDVPTGSIALLGVVPADITHSVNILSPTSTISVSGATPDVGGGAFVDNPSRQDSYVSHSESIGNHSIAEFAVGEGPDETTLSGRRAARLPVVTNPIIIQAGKLIDVPTASIAALGRVPEIDSRRRALRAQAILS